VKNTSLHRTSNMPLSERQSSKPILKAILTFFKNIFSKKKITKPVDPPTLPNDLKDYIENLQEAKEARKLFKEIAGNPLPDYPLYGYKKKLIKTQEQELKNVLTKIADVLNAPATIGGNALIIHNDIEKTVIESSCGTDGETTGYELIRMNKRKKHLKSKFKK
jgi:hypothetical protein